MNENDLIAAEEARIAKEEGQSTILAIALSAIGMLLIWAVT